MKAPRTERRFRGLSWKNSFRPGIEHLEERLAFAVDFVNATGSPFAIGAGTDPRYLVPGDFNSDSVLDLAVIDQNNGGSGNKVSMLIGTGNGSFTLAPTTYAVGSQPTGATTGDFNHDGKLDLAVTNISSQNVSILLGNGAGGFGTATNIALGGGNNPYSVTAGDFNRDGNADLAVSISNTGTIKLLIGDGTGGFAVSATLTAASSTGVIAIGDLNRDGFLDLAVAVNSPANLVGVYYGDGSGGFSAATYFNPNAMGPSGLALADFNNDGILDIATSNGSNSVSVLIGDGTGSFAAGTAYAVGTSPLYLAAGDFNYDGYVDIAASNSNSDNISVLVNDGSGGFVTPTNFPVGDNPGGIVAADFNSDGLADLAVANLGTGDTVSVLLNVAASPVTQVNGTLNIVLTGTVTLTQLSKDSANVVLNGSNIGNFAGVSNIVVQGLPSNDALRLANRVDIPLRYSGGAGTDTFDASAIASIITTFVGPNSNQPSSFEDVEILSVGYTVFLPGADITGVIDTNGNVLDFSRLGIIIDANLDSVGINVNNKLSALRVDYAIGSLFANNRIAPGNKNATKFLGRNLS